MAKVTVGYPFMGRGGRYSWTLGEAMYQISVADRSGQGFGGGTLYYFAPGASSGKTIASDGHHVWKLPTAAARHAVKYHSDLVDQRKASDGYFAARFDRVLKESLLPDTMKLAAARAKTVRANLQKLATREGLSSRQQMVLRLASRWVRAGAEAKLDLLVRLQVLEGAAGVREGTFTRNLRSGLAEARKAFERDTLNPEWFSTGSTGAYMMLKNGVGAMYRASDIAFFDEDDAMQMAMSGLGAKTMVKGKIMSYEAGKGLAAKIKKGKETPRSILGGKIYPWIRKRLISEVDLIKKHAEQEGGEAQPVDQVPLGEEEQAGRGVIAPVTAKTRFEIVFQALGDSFDDLGQRIYDWAHSAFGGKAGGKYLTTWLDFIRKEGGRYHGIWRDVAERLGVARQSIASKKTAVQSNFIKALMRQTGLMNEVDARVVRSEAMARVARGRRRSLNRKQVAILTKHQKFMLGGQDHTYMSPTSWASLPTAVQNSVLQAQTQKEPDWRFYLEDLVETWLFEHSSADFIRSASGPILVTLNLKKTLRTVSGQQADVGAKVGVSIDPSSKVARITPLVTRDTFFVRKADLPNLVYRLDGKDSNWTKYLNL